MFIREAYSSNEFACPNKSKDKLERAISSSRVGPLEHQEESL